MDAHELREFAKDIYDGGYREGDLEDILFEFGEYGLTREDAEKVCEILADIDGRQ